jgi:histidinol-phosphate aminotransferase
MIFLNRNENTRRDASRWDRLLQRASGVDLARYPDIDYGALRGALGKHVQMPPACIHVGAGSSELLVLIGTAFVRPGGRVLASSYTFELYRHVATTRGAELVTVASKDYAHDLDAMLACDARGGVDAIFIDNPCNPTGSFIPPEPLDAFLQRVCKDTVVVVDEAYIDFVEGAGQRSAAALLDRHANLVVVRTFSKAFGLAGLRVGYCLGHSNLIERLRAVSHPFCIGAMAEAVAMAALQEPGYVAESVRHVATERERFARALAGSRYRTTTPAASFIFLNMRDDGDRFLALLGEQGIRVREFADYPGHVRVTFGTPEINEVILGLLARMEAAREGASA